VVLAEYLEQHRTLVERKSVVELGAGTGLVGIIAAMLGEFDFDMLTSSTCFRQ